MNFLKNLFSPQREEKPRPCVEDKQKSVCTNEKNPQSCVEASPRHTVSFFNLFDEEDGTEGADAFIFHGKHESPQSECSDDERSCMHPVIPFRQVVHAVRRIKTASHWESWCDSLFSSSTSHPDKVHYVRFVAEKLQSAGRSEECFAVLTHCMNMLICKAEMLPVENYVNLFEAFDHRRPRRRSRAEAERNSTGDAPSAILRIVLLDAYHLQQIIRGLHVEANAVNGAGSADVSWRIEITSPRISNFVENVSCQQFVVTRVAFALSYVSSCESCIESVREPVADAQHHIDQIRFLCFANVMTLIQKLRYPFYGGLCAMMLSVCGGFTEGSFANAARVADQKWKVNGEDIKVHSPVTPIQPNRCFTSVSVLLTPEYTNKLASAMFSTGIMYLSAFQRAHTSHKKALHQCIFAQFEGAEFAYDPAERILPRRHASVAVSIDARLGILRGALNDCTAIGENHLSLTANLHVGIMLFEWLLRAQQAGSLLSHDFLCAKTGPFLLNLADLLHFDGNDHEAVFICSFLAEFSDSANDSNFRHCALDRIGCITARHALRLEYRSRDAEALVFGGHSDIPQDSPIRSSLVDFHAGKITPGALANALQPALARFVPVMRNGSEAAHEVAVLRSINEAYDVCEACCALGDIFLARDHADLALQLFLTVIRMVTSIPEMCSWRLFSMACCGIGCAQGNRAVERSICASIQCMLDGIFGCDHTMNPLETSAAMTFTRIMLQGNTDLKQIRVRGCFRLGSVLLGEQATGEAFLVPQGIDNCHRAIHYAQSIDGNTINEALDGLHRNNLCPFTSVLHAKIIARDALDSNQQRLVLDSVSQHHCAGQCPAIDRRHSASDAAARFFTVANDKVAKILQRHAGMGFDALTENLEDHEDTLFDIPLSVSLCCVTCDPMMADLWIIRGDAIEKNASKYTTTEYVALRLPVNVEVIELINTFLALIKRSSVEITKPSKKDIGTPQEDTAANRKRFWAQRKYFDSEIALLLERFAHILGPWQAFMVGLPLSSGVNRSSKAVSDLSAKYCDQICAMLANVKAHSPVGVLTPYVLQVLLSFAPFFQPTESPKLLRKETVTSIHPDRFISPILKLLGVQNASPETHQELSTCVSEMVNELLDVTGGSFLASPHDHTNVGSVDSPNALSSTAASRRKVWLLLDQSLCESFPWEMLPIYQKCTSPVVRITSIRCALRLHALGKGSETSDVLSPSGYSFTSTPSLFYCLNPSGNMEGSQQRFLPLFQSVLQWNGVVGAVDASKCVAGVRQSEVYLYIGHGNGEKCTPRHRLVNFSGPVAEPRQSQSRLVLLMGCSSCALYHGPLNTPNTFLTTGSTRFMGTLWDVTDGEIDRLTTSFVLDTVVPPDVPQSLEETHKQTLDEKGRTPCIRELFPTKQLARRQNSSREVHSALHNARLACKLPYLTGASVVFYGV